MATVRILKDWEWPDILRQSPNNKGIWGNISITADESAPVDYVIVLNKPSQRYEVMCPWERIWVISQEPPIGKYENHHKLCSRYGRVYTSAVSVPAGNAVPSQPALCWYVNKSYDELTKYNVPDKTGQISWVTSNKAFLPTHIKRLEFLHRVRKSVDVVMYGKGFNYIEDKWDALAPFKYSLAIENYANDYYWSEKIADCFLSWAMPIYFGCRRISSFFPEGSYVQLDIADPDAVDKVREAISGDLWERNIDAIAEARRLVLKKYQLFPFLASQIEAYESQAGVIQNTPDKQVCLAPIRLRKSLAYNASILVPSYIAKLRKVSKIDV